MTPTGPRLAGLARRWGGRLPDDRASAGSGDPPATNAAGLQCLAVAHAVGGPSRATMGGGPAWRVVAIGWTGWSDGRGECKGRQPLVRRPRESVSASGR
ncbi:hypothetical protein GGG16DRAFT_125003 [Schizophyllum commune]